MDSFFPEKRDQSYTGFFLLLLSRILREKRKFVQNKVNSIWTEPNILRCPRLQTLRIFPLDTLFK